MNYGDDELIPFDAEMAARAEAAAEEAEMARADTWAHEHPIEAYEDEPDAVRSAEVLINFEDLLVAMVRRECAERAWKESAKGVIRASARTGAGIHFLRQFVGAQKNWPLDKALNTVEGHIRKGVPLI